jgi:alpha,alpha-trehalase
VIGQFQLDGLGEILDLFAAAARLDLLAEENWHAATAAAEAIEKRWREPDAGIWELDDRHWTHSRLACMSGLRFLAAVTQGPPGGHGHRQAARWSALADSILASVHQRQLRGNLPQAFVHAGMLECAARLSAATRV